MLHYSFRVKFKELSFTCQNWCGIDERGEREFELYIEMNGGNSREHIS